MLKKVAKTEWMSGIVCTHHNILSNNVEHVNNNLSKAIQYSWMTKTPIFTTHGGSIESCVWF